MKNDVYIIAAKRTAVGSLNGSLSALTSHDLGAQIMRGVLDSSSIDGSVIDEAVFGNIMNTEPRGNPSREAWLQAGLPQQTPSYTVNKNCISGLKAVELAALSLLAQDREVVMAGGYESMSGAPFLLRGVRKQGVKMGQMVLNDYLLEGLEGMGLTAERVAVDYEISRRQQDEFACESQRRATTAIEAGWFKDQIVPIVVKEKRRETIVDLDEAVKAETTVDSLTKLKPVFQQNGTVTAGNSSTINDGAAALILANEQGVKKHGLTPLARVVGSASAGLDPRIMGMGPYYAAPKLLANCGLTMSDIDCIELNEAFAAQVLGNLKALEMDNSKVNPDGGAIALGHPVGATGALLVVKILYYLRRTKGRYGMITLCAGGGQGMAMIIENLCL